MKTSNQRHPAASAICLIMLGTLAGAVSAQSTDDRRTETEEAVGAPAQSREAAAKRHVDEAVAVVRRMKSEPRVNELLQRAKGVFIVPAYARAALGVGASGGAGVLLVKADGTNWSEPIFYNLGGFSAGAQAGAEGGTIVMILNNDKAVSRFMQKNAFSLNADTGLTIVNWSKTAQGTVGIGDVVAWADTKGLYGNVVSVGVNDIRFNQNLTDAYYHLNLSPRDVIIGRVRNEQAEPLRQALGPTSGGPMTGASGSGSSGSGSGKPGKPDDTR